MQVLQMGAYPPPHGGVQTNVVAIRTHLLDRGIPCSVINLTRHRDSQAENLYHPRNALEVIKLLLSLKFDIVHLHHGGELTPRLLAMYLFCSLLPGKKTVLTCHSGGYATSTEEKRARWWSLPGFIFRRLSSIIAVNPELCDVFRRFGVPDARIHLILPFALKTPAADRKLPAPIDNFFLQHHPKLLTVGLLEPEYDLTLQIDALERILDDHPNAGLAIIGSGSLQQQLTDHIRTKSYSDRVLLCGDVDHGDTLCAIRDCDIFLRTTLYDGDAVSVREALHLGKRVIASDNGMRPTGVRLVPRQDLVALCASISESLQVPILKTELSPSDDANMQAVLELYRRLLSTSR
ncbi:MAG: glycosyltransferase family 4 protein [Planctomycetota bacterium]|nr:glycosyltransferase family 4 protein [Planctomycetota bacterium]MDA1177710.1 glycosyltransferase family 4 protein [Planctomycetota bacterium]